MKQQAQSCWCCSQPKIPGTICVGSLGTEALGERWGGPPFPPLPMWKQLLKTPFLIGWRKGCVCPFQNPFSSHTLFSTKYLFLYQRKTLTCDFSITFFLQTGAFHVYFFLSFDEWVNWYSKSLTVLTKICQVLSLSRAGFQHRTPPSNRYSFPEASLQPPPRHCSAHLISVQTRIAVSSSTDWIVDRWWWKDAKLLWRLCFCTYHLVLFCLLFIILNFQHTIEGRIPGASVRFLPFHS